MGHAQVGPRYAEVFPTVLSPQVDEMSEQRNPVVTNQTDDFARHATGSSPGIVREFWDFLRENKKWWLAPIFIVLLLLGALIAVAGTGAAPFIYTLF